MMWLLFHTILYSFCHPSEPKPRRNAALSCCGPLLDVRGEEFSNIDIVDEKEMQKLNTEEETKELEISEIESFNNIITT